MRHRTLTLSLVVALAILAFFSVPRGTADTDIGGDDNADVIKIPHGEDKTLWELATDPFTRVLGSVFHLWWIMMISGMIWWSTESLGPPLMWIIVVSTALAGLPIPGVGTAFFVLVAALGITVAVVRLIVKRRMR